MKLRISHTIATWGIAIGMLAVALITGPAHAAQDVDLAEPDSCTQCHVSENPTHEEPDLIPCPANREPRADAPAADNDIPKVILLDALAKHYGGVLFNHGGHAAMSEMSGGCATCHHHSTLDQIERCGACHESAAAAGRLDQPGLRGAYHRQCLACHRDWTHDTACKECHRDSGPKAKVVLAKDSTDIIGVKHPKITPMPTYIYTPEDDDPDPVTFHHADHVGVFGLQCASCHSEEGCGECHDMENKGNKLKRVREDPHEDCAGCHALQIDEDCLFCHTETERPRFDHTVRTDFDLTRWHGELSCDACHEKRGEFAGLNKDCVECHSVEWQPEGFDHAATGFELDETHIEVDCFGCHMEGLGPRPRCDACHDEEFGPEPKEVAEGAVEIVTGNASNLDDAGAEPELSTE